MADKVRDSLPILDLSLALDESTRQAFLADLKTYLLDIGFFYIKNLPLQDGEIFDKIKTQSWDFFDLPLEKKLEVEMVNSPHFLGYTKLGNEITAGKLDWREQIDLATELPEPVIPNGPGNQFSYKNIEGPNLWPDARELPQFRPTFENYIEELSVFSIWFVDLIRESLGLPPGAFDKFFKKPRQQCKLKSIKYPDLQKLTAENMDKIVSGSTAHNDNDQGVGEHKDSDFITYIYQATDHNCLQVQNFANEWISVPPLDSTLVVAVGQTLEALTQGVCMSTIHRVLTPSAGQGDRLSIPFFQTVNIETFKEALDIPQSLIDERIKRDEIRKSYGSKIGFQFSIDDNDKPVGWYVFRNRIKSHQDVSAKWYPEVLEEVLKVVQSHSTVPS